MPPAAASAATAALLTPKLRNKTRASTLNTAANATHRLRFSSSVIRSTGDDDGEAPAVEPGERTQQIPDRVGRRLASARHQRASLSSGYPASRASIEVQSEPHAAQPAPSPLRMYRERYLFASPPRAGRPDKKGPRPPSRTPILVALNLSASYGPPRCDLQRQLGCRSSCS
jgi:hypothetical protein